MIHPDTTLRWISEDKGFGIFATKRIPKGTLTFVQDDLDIRLSPDNELLKKPHYMKIVEKYSYINCDGEFVISWDHGKFMNHCCFSNTITTGFGFEVAVDDIEAGKEVTVDYGVFTISHVMNITCSKPGCRKILSHSEFDGLAPGWDARIRSSLDFYQKVDQPLAVFLDDGTKSSLDRFLTDSAFYIPVSNQKPGFSKKDLGTNL